MSALYLTNSGHLEFSKINFVSSGENISGTKAGVGGGNGK